MLETGLAIGIVVVFNLCVLFYKLYKKKYLDLAFDILILVGLTNVFGASTLALIIGNFASFLMSIALYWMPLDNLFPVVGSIRKFFKRLSEPKPRLKRRRYA